MIEPFIYQKSVLPGGLRVVTERIPHVRSVSLGFWILDGTRDEMPEENGISHFVEHMMFKGTRRRKVNEIAESLEAVGGHLNAFTGKEVTCYYAHILDEHVPIAVDVLADILTDSTFPDEEIVKEKAVVVEEINAVDDMPEDLVHELFYRDLFPSHSLGASTLGTRETVNSFSRDQLYGFVARHYTRNRLIISAAGNIEHSELVDLLGNRLDAFGYTSDRALIAPTLPRTVGSVTEHFCTQTHVVLGTRALQFDDPRKFSFLTMNTLLGGGMSSRLFQNIRERHGLAYSIFSFHDFMYDTGVFGIYMGVDSAREQQASGLLREELRKMRDELVSTQELERTKSQLKGSLMLGLESTSSRMSRLANMEMYLGQYFTLDEVLEGIGRVTQEDMRQLARELFIEDRLTSTVIRPSAKGDADESASLETQ